MIAAQSDLGTDAILKTRRLGYDGKGQAPLGKGEPPGPAWDSVGKAPCVLEGKVAFEREISVIVVRGVNGEIAYYDVPVNTHKGGILRKSVVPCGLPRRMSRTRRGSPRASPRRSTTSVCSP